MVSADNVNYDVLTLIFAFLGNNDLVSTCLVSRSFRIGATPRLYRSISFRIDNMKRWPGVASPFTVIVSRPSLGVHVRYCDVKAIPRLKGQPHPSFIASCAQSLRLCPNMLSFTYISDAPPFLPLLATKERLTELKIHAALNTEQAKTLSLLHGLHSLSLYQASWNICNALTAWIPKLAPTLTSLTLANSRYLNEAVLETLLPHVSSIRGLHIVGCAQVGHHAVLRLVSHTPLLESLSLSTWENSSTSPNRPSVSLPRLLHLSLDTRCTFAPHAVPALYSTVFTALAACPLKSLTFKLSERMVVGDAFINQVLDDHSGTFTRFNAVNVCLSQESMESICVRCVHLEQLAIVAPVRDIDALADALVFAQNLHTLIDVGDSHSTHGLRVTLDASDARVLFGSTPSLRTIISGNRCWTCQRVPVFEPGYDYENDYDVGNADYHEITLKLERLRRGSRAAYEFGNAGC